MNIVPLLLFCSLALVIGSIVLFVFSAKQGDCDESDRLCLLPLEDDADVRPVRAAQAPPIAGPIAGRVAGPVAGDASGPTTHQQTTLPSPESES